MLNKEKLWTVFSRFDTDNSGGITRSNLVEVMHKLGKEKTNE